MDKDGKLFFRINANGTLCNVIIDFDEKSGKYNLRSLSLSKKYANKEKESLIEVLNKFQFFIIIPEQDNSVYGYVRFYRPAVKVGADFEGSDSQMNKIIFPCKVLSDIGDEKGKSLPWNTTRWPKQTLFNIVDTLGKGTDLERFFGNPDIIVCDDIATECADFIVSEPNKVIFIHVKGIGTNNKKGSECSASSLVEVCGQATKNVQYLSMFNSRAPSKVDSWLEALPYY